MCRSAPLAEPARVGHDGLRGASSPTDTGTEVPRGATRRFPVAKEHFVYIGTYGDFGALALGADHRILGKNAQCPE